MLPKDSWTGLINYSTVALILISHCDLFIRKQGLLCMGFAARSPQLLCLPSLLSGPAWLALYSLFG